MANDTRTPSGIIIALVCAGLVLGSLWMIIDGVRTGAWIQGAAALLSMPFFLVGAIGGLLGPDRLPEKSIADLIGWTAVDRVLSRPIRDWWSAPERP